MLAELGIKQTTQQLPVHEESQKYLNIMSPLGILQYLRVPAGIQAAEEILEEIFGKIFKTARRVKLIHNSDKIMLCTTNITNLEGQMRETIKVAEEFGVVFDIHRIRVGGPTEIRGQV